MDAFHETNLAALARHHNGGSARAVAEETHAFHQRAVGDAGGREDEVVARSQIFGG